jgi:hypothetical protein
MDPSRHDLIDKQRLMVTRLCVVSGAAVAAVLVASTCGMHALEWQRDAAAPAARETLFAVPPPPLVSIIVPTTGRASLTASLKSLQRLSSTNATWEAILVVDGLAAESAVAAAVAVADDDRIHVVHLGSRLGVDGSYGKHAAGGLVRNVGMALATGVYVLQVCSRQRLS